MPSGWQFSKTLLSASMIVGKRMNHQQMLLILAIMLAREQAAFPASPEAPCMPTLGQVLGAHNHTNHGVPIDIESTTSLEPPGAHATQSAAVDHSSPTWSPSITPAPWTIRPLASKARRYLGLVLVGRGFIGKLLQAFHPRTK